MSGVHHYINQWLQAPQGHEITTSYSDGCRWLWRSRNLFFLDSKTAPGEIAKLSAKNADVTYLSRNIFLDNVQETEYVKNQLYKAVDLAQRKGVSISIGHPYAVTYQVLAQHLPILEEKGIRIVRISDLIGEIQ